MEKIEMYPMLTKENKFLGLEPVDLLVLLTLYLFVFLFSNHLVLNLTLIAFFYSFLRFYKRNKPPRYTQNLIRFFLIPSRYTEAREVSR